jgi:hypothetical protein
LTSLAVRIGSKHRARGRGGLRVGFRKEFDVFLQLQVEFLY